MSGECDKCGEHCLECKCIYVWVDIKDADKIRKTDGFIPASQYLPENRWEYGMSKQKDVVLRYRLTEFVRYIKNIFCE